MNPRDRLTIGAIGGVAPVVLNLIVVDLTTALRDLTAVVVLAYLVRVLALVFAGAVAGWLHEDETKASKIFQLGMVAPALLTGVINGAALRADATGHGAQAWGVVTEVHASQMAQTVQPLAGDWPSQVWRGLFGIRNEPADILVIVGSFQNELQARHALTSLRQRYPLPFTLYLPAPPVFPYWMVTLGSQMTWSDFQRAKADADRVRLPIDVRTIPK